MNEYTLLDVSFVIVITLDAIKSTFFYSSLICFAYFALFFNISKRRPRINTLCAILYNFTISTQIYIL